MGMVDKDKVQKVVYEMSQGSAHFKREEQKQQLLEEKTAALKKRAASLSLAELAGHTRYSYPQLHHHMNNFSISMATTAGSNLSLVSYK
jgi:hypothetical protein